MYGNFQAVIASSDLPAFDCGELAGRLVHPRFLRMDRLGPEPPVAAVVEGAALVGDCFGRVLHDSALVADHTQVVQRDAAEADAILGSHLADDHRRCCRGDSAAWQVPARHKWDRVRQCVCILGVVLRKKSTASHGRIGTARVHDPAVRLGGRVRRT